MDVATSFKILEIGITSDMADLKRAYRVMAKRYHPDRFDHDPVLKKRAESRMKQINLAFKTASDFVNSLKKSEKQNSSSTRETMPKSSSSSPEADQAEKVREEKSGRDGFEKNHSENCEDNADLKKRQISVALIFAWCRNLIFSVTDEFFSYGKKSSNINSSSATYNNTFEQQQSASCDRFGSKKKDPATASANKQIYPENSNSSKHSRKHTTTEFDSILRQSVKSFKSEELRNNTIFNAKASQAKRCDTSGCANKAHHASARSNSPFRYIKRRKKFIDSNAGPVERISPISSVNKI